jgi:hypothetical protein
MRKHTPGGHIDDGLKGHGDRRIEPGAVATSAALGRLRHDLSPFYFRIWAKVNGSGKDFIDFIFDI